MPKVLLDFSKVDQIDAVPQTKVQKTTIEDGGLFEIVNQALNGRNFGLGLHSTTKSESEVKEIIKSGLFIKENESFLSTVSSFGMRNEIQSDHLKQSVLNYSWKTDDQSNFNIVVLVPTVIKNSLGEKLFLGFPPYNTSCNGNNYRTTCNLDSVCRGNKENGNVPSEFIFGYFKNDNGKIRFEQNPQYYQNLPKEEKDKLFEKCSKKIVGQNREISDAVINEDVEALKQLSEEEQTKIKTEIKTKTKENVLKGMSQTLAKELAEKSVKIHQNDVATNALQYLENLLEKQLELNFRS